MKKKYFFKPSITIYIATAILTIILLIGIIVNILTLVGVIGLVSLNFVVDIISLVLMFIALGITLFIGFFSHYTIGEKKFAFCIGFIWKGINYSDILLLRKDPQNDLLLMYFKMKNKKGEEELKYMSIKIKSKLFDEFIADIKKFNPLTVYEIFDKNTDEEL